MNNVKNLPDIKRNYVSVVLRSSTGRKSEDLCYVPELNKWIKRHSMFRGNKPFSKKKNICYRDWILRWVIFANDVNNLSYKEASLLVEELYPEKLPNTKEYIARELTKDPHYSCDFWCIKQDIIDQYYISRAESNLPIFNMDFSEVPDIIMNYDVRFYITCNEIINKELIGKFSTSYRIFIYNKNDGKLLGKYKSSKSKQMSNDEFLEKARKIHGDKYTYTSYPSDDRDENDKILIKCNRCGSYFWQNIRCHISGQGCPKCNASWDYKSGENIGRNKIPFSDFVKKSQECHGSRYDYVEDSYTGMSNKVTIIDTITGDVFEQQAYAHCHGEGNPSIKSSNGETYIERWLSYKNIPYKKDKSVNCKGLTTLRNTVRPDFQILFNDKFYWIEYNGIQHYKYLPKLFHKEGLCKFIDQIDRDNFIKEYCSNNKIICIVIPYLYDTYNEIAEILESCIIQEISPESIIKYPEINLIESN